MIYNKDCFVFILYWSDKYILIFKLKTHMIVWWEFPNLYLETVVRGIFSTAWEPDFLTYSLIVLNPINWVLKQIFEVLTM